MALEVRADDAPHGWDDALAEAGGTAFHTVGWARHKCHGGAGEALYCTWRDEEGGEEVARALAIRRPPRSSRVGRLASRLVFDSPPVRTSPDGDLVGPLEAWAKRWPALIEVELGSLDQRAPWCPEPIPNVRPRREYVIELDGDGDVWSGMNRASRRNVKRATAAGLETQTGTTGDLDMFVSLYRSTLERLRASKGVDFRLDDASFRDSLAPLLEDGLGHLFLTGAEGVVEAGWIFIGFGDGAYSVYSGTTDSGRAADAGSLVLFDALCDMSRRGFARLNLGGADWSAPDPESPDHGLHVYKTRLGAVPRECFSGTLALRPWRARMVESVRRVVGR